MKYSKLNKLKKEYKFKHQRELWKIPLFQYINKMQFKGKGWLSYDMIEKKKLTYDDLYYYLHNL